MPTLDRPIVAGSRRALPGAFTLIELLVVISIIALLVGILLPALSAARKRTRVATCLNSQRQLAVGVAAYAADHRDLIPRGPDSTALTPMNWGISTYREWQVASSMIWLPPTPGGFPPPERTSWDYNAHGVLLTGYLSEPRSMFCPGDNTRDPTDELAHIGKNLGPAFSSFVYRQLQQAPGGRLAQMGTNGVGRPALVLTFDSNSIANAGPGTHRTNHDADPVNMSFVDGHARGFPNSDKKTLNLVDADYASWNAVEARYNLILQTGDAGP